jgi:hypothetical protein
MNVKIKITDLKKSLSSANVWIRGKLHSIYFSPDRAFGFVVDANPMAQVGDEVELSEGPNKGLGSGIIVELTF